MPEVKRYNNLELCERLAGEYVLGTLQGAARRRFEGLMQERPYIRYAVELWERRLHPLTENLAPVEPDAAVWKNIRQRLFGQTAMNKTAFWNRAGVWQFATGVLSALLAVAVLLPRPVKDMPELSWVSVLESEDHKPMLVTTGMRDMGMVEIRLLEMPQAKDQQWVLWALPKDGSAPIAVGALRHDSMETKLKFSRDEWRTRIRGADMFAVSFEPMPDRKGSAMPQAPQGPIMYKGKCLDFI
jgi:anti-sigma-K factor RskA